MKSMALLASLVLLFLAIPVQAQTMTPAQQADVEKTVKDLIVQMYKSVETLNVEDFFKFLSRERFFGQPASGRIFSYDEMKQQWIKDYETRKEAKRDAKVVTVRVLSPDAAVAHWTGTGMNALKNGNVSNFQAAGIAVCAKETSGWKVISITFANQVLQ